MQITIRHQLRVGFGTGIAHAVQQLLLTPSKGPTQTIKSWSIEADGFAEAAKFTDAFGNQAHLVSQTKPEGDFLVNVSGVVETTDKNGVLGRPQGEPPVAIFRRLTPLTKFGNVVLGKFRGDEMGRIAVLHALMERGGELYQFGEAEDEAEQTQSQDGQSQSQGGSGGGGGEKTVETAAEFAHAFISAARALDIPARFVTGYLLPEGDTPAEFHAWAEAWDDGLGWIGFDAALGICPTDRHVRVAIGLDAVGTAPVRAVPHVGEIEAVSLTVTAG